jgi:hypothetical protein
LGPRKRRIHRLKICARFGSAISYGTKSEEKNREPWHAWKLNGIHGELLWESQEFGGKLPRAKAEDASHHDNEAIFTQSKQVLVN